MSLTCAAAPIPVRVGFSADAFVREQDPGVNYGLAGALAVSGTASVNRKGTAMGRTESFMRFETTGLVGEMDALFGAGGWEVESAVLRINEQARPNNTLYNRGLGKFDLCWIADDDWQEGSGYPKADPPRTDGITFESSRSLLGEIELLGTFGNYGPDAADDFIDLFCTLDLSDAEAFLADVAAAGAVTLFLRPTDGAAGDAFGLQFASATGGGQGGGGGSDDESPFAPYLEFMIDEATGQEVIPEPASALLFAAGLLAAARRRRRCASER